MFEKGARVPTVFERHARQQQAALFAALDHQAVFAAGDDLFRSLFAGGAHRLRIEQQPNLHAQVGQFRGRQWRKAYILERRAQGGVVHGPAQRETPPLQAAAAGPQMFAALQTHERAGQQ